MNLLHSLVLALLVAFARPQCYDTTFGCDSRCNCCNDLIDLSNYNCATCNTSHLAYMWLQTSPPNGAATSRCETYCPPGQYIDTSVAANIAFG